jgi:tetratricopeptide (TPR) repeat protein
VYRTIRQHLSGEYRASQKVQMLVAQARSHLKQNNLDRAISVCEEAIAIDPDHVKAYSMCGMARTWQGDYRAAIRDCDRAIDLDPGGAMYAIRGLAHQGLGNIEMALRDFDQAIALRPDDPIARLNRLKLHQELGNTETALADLEYVIETMPELAEKELTKNLLSELQEPRGQ